MSAFHPFRLVTDIGRIPQRSMISPVRREGSIYYREQAKRCRELAERQPKADVKARLLEVAQQYEKLTEDAKAKGE